jgi:hypothetical protein
MYNLIPYFSAEMIQEHMNEIGKLTFSQLDSFMYLRMTNNEGRFYSPSKINHMSANLQCAKVKLNTIEKMSTRLETLKKDDSLLNFDIVEHFWSRMNELKLKLNLPDMSPIS